jgi:hypothetical protein
MNLHKHDLKLSFVSDLRPSLNGSSDCVRLGAVPSLNPAKQVWWGFLGGCLVLGFRLWIYANALSAESAWPSVTFRTLLLFLLWCAFPFVSGLISRALDPHHRLHAIFEGASAPALFFAIAKDLPF